MKSITLRGLSLQFDAGQITHGSADDQAGQAVELINRTLQREPFGLGAQLIVHAAGVLPELVNFLQAASEAVGNCEESLEGLIGLRGWLEDRLHALNLLPDLAAALELAESSVRYHHVREGCPVTLQAVRRALRKTRNIETSNPSTRRRPCADGSTQ